MRAERRQPDFAGNSVGGCGMKGRNAVENAELTAVSHPLASPGSAAYSISAGIFFYVNV